MKVTKISLKNFHQFKDLKIDLTYPKGHPKAGEPLDKVCIIGQSGTGKTTLLKLIGGYTYTKDSLIKEYSLSDLENVVVTRKIAEIIADINLLKDNDEDFVSYNWSNYTKSGKEVDFELAKKEYIALKDNIKNQYIHFPAELKFDVKKSDSKNLLVSRVIDFSDFNLGDIWETILMQVKGYREKILFFKQNIANVAQEESVDIKKIQKEIKKLENWQKNNKNPVDKLALECLDDLLIHFNLRVKREFEFKTEKGFSFIEIEDLDGNTIPQNLFSTGTKQVIFSATPLYLLKPEDALILFDEPERSLYPNIQKIIIDFYTSLAKNSQFFFATHSPIIASSFEPWEIIELKFDDKGKVYQELYYDTKKERHVDNYTIVPSYLTYDLMLDKVFDLKETYSTDRSEKITEVLMLRNQIKTYKEKNKLDTDAAKKVIEKYKSLAQKLFWDFEI